MKKIIMVTFLIFCSNCVQKNKQDYEEGIKRFNQISNNFINPNLENGEKIFNKICITCHLYGAGGSIPLSDKKSWELIARDKKLQDIYVNVINGYSSKNGFMPKKGACLDCDDKDISDVISYIYAYHGLIIHH